GLVLWPSRRSPTRHGSAPRWPGDCSTWSGRRRAAEPGSDQTEGGHGAGHPLEPGDVGAGHVVAGDAELLGGLVAGVVEAAHDLGQATFGVLEAPRVAAGVLLHLEGRGRHPACVGRLAGTEWD